MHSYKDILTMEHRWGVRRILNINAIIHSHSQGALSAQVRNISSSGMYAETGIELDVNQSVTIEFSQPYSPLIYLLSAYVIRATSEGAALMFNEPNTKELSNLLDRLTINNAPGIDYLAEIDPKLQRDSSRGVN